MTDETPEPLVQVGWYCWRCHAINRMACRSDCVPIHVPAEWADEMRAEIARREDEDAEPPASDAGPDIREAAADDRRWPLEKAGE